MVGVVLRSFEWWVVLKALYLFQQHWLVIQSLEKVLLRPQPQATLLLDSFPELSESPCHLGCRGRVRRRLGSGRKQCLTCTLEESLSSCRSHNLYSALGWGTQGGLPERRGGAVLFWVWVVPSWEGASPGRLWRNALGCTRHAALIGSRMIGSYHTLAVGLVLILLLHSIYSLCSSACSMEPRLVSETWTASN